MTHAVYPSLAGKTVVITGGGSGIGEVIVEGFVRQKSKVFFLDVAESESRALVTRLADGAKFVNCDVTDLKALRAALADIEAKAGPVGALVNNAANDDRHRVEDVTPEYWENRIAVNLRLTEPGPVAHLPIEHFEGLDSFEDLPRDGRCVADLWF